MTVSGMIVAAGATDCPVPSCRHLPRVNRADMLEQNNGYYPLPDVQRNRNSIFTSSTYYFPATAQAYRYWDEVLEHAFATDLPRSSTPLRPAEPVWRRSTF